MAESSKKPRQKKYSLTKESVIMILVLAIVVGTFSIAVYDKGAYDMIVAQFKRYSIDVAKLVAIELDRERVFTLREAVKEVYDHSETRMLSDQWNEPGYDAYISQYEPIYETEAYQTLYDDLQRMQGQLNVDCLYLTWVDTENQCTVYLLDAALEEPCPVGCIDPIYLDDVEGALNNLSQGFLPNITKTAEYGWLLATDMPIFDDAGNIIAMAAVDISMNAAMTELINFMSYIILAFVGITLVFCLLAILLVNRIIVKPINLLSRAASEYTHDNNTFSKLNISRHDEIGVLANSMVKMADDIEHYIDDLSSTREYADEMDREANTDALTKARSKRAYALKVKQLNELRRPYGIAVIDINGLKTINDTYGHEMGDVSIKIVCRIIGRVFDYSNVYRFGGDEFIVVLENEDYANREALIDELTEAFRANQANESAEPWERVCAAIGFAAFDPEVDESVKTVVQRADDAMYKNKKAAKEER